MIGLFGGAFDPVHFGHLRTALEVCQSLGLHELRLVPTGRPPHRDPPHAGAAQRLAMLELATADQPGLIVDPRELHREGPSYSVLTLRELRAAAGATPVCMVLGRDAFYGLDRWWRWEEVLDLCHLVVVERAQGVAPPAMAALLEERRCGGAAQLAARPSGLILPLSVTRLDISATDIRAQVAAGRSPRYLLPDAVYDYIRRHGLYSQATER